MVPRPDDIGRSGLKAITRVPEIVAAPKTVDLKENWEIQTGGGCEQGGRKCT